MTRFLPAGARARLLTTRRCFGRGLLATQVSKKAASKWVELPFAGEGGQRRPLSQACDHIQSGADWRDLPSAALKAEGRRSACSCCLSTKQKMTFCDADDKQSENLIAWSLPHTADRHNNWSGVYGRVDWEGIFKTTSVDSEPLGEQGQVLHPTQDRLLSVREYTGS